ncbi:TetR family transcriptional regulator [Georgenia halophila]|uniref:TetR family transcriptional regulator n=1 Tax=Georgenia halophila TaxID=620889 RepID=A0ABP8LDN5_9MICO
MRAIAADAGVSAGLIVHHFGSRAGLRQACDDHVLTQIRDAKSSVLVGPSAPSALLAQIAQVEGYAPLVGYAIRALQAGGSLADRFIDHFVDDLKTYLRAAEEAGNIRPSRDPEGRAELLSEMAIGAMMFRFSRLGPDIDLDDLPRWLRETTDRISLPALELYTEPLLTDSSLLDTYLAAHGSGHGGGGAAARDDAAAADKESHQL